MSNIPKIGNSGSSTRANSRMASATILFAAVFFSCLFGIWTRPVGFLATFWPANAVMLGLLIRFPSSNGRWGWAAGAIAFMAADLMSGSPITKTLILNCANLVGIAAAYVVYTRLTSSRAALQQPASMFYLLVSAATGGAAAGVIGGIANPLLFGGTVMNGWTFWFATEFVNYVAILPVLLSLPSLSTMKHRVTDTLLPRKSDYFPAAALIVSFALAVIIGGPGAIAFPVPALLWCGLAYPVFPTAVLTFLYGVWTLVVISSGYVPAQIHDEMTLVSLRLGISLIAVAPIMLACVMQSRHEVLARLHHMATHDPLTGVLNRKAFRDDAEQRLARAQQPCALLMFDLDHFKRVNDTYGHAAGDKVLKSFADRARACLRVDDLLGRLGGEEFAAMVFDCSETHVTALAERLRTATREPVLLEDGRTLSVSTSIGIVIAEPKAGPGSIDDMFQRADAMLYRAKAAGRDRAEISILGADIAQPALIGCSKVVGSTALSS